MNYKLSIYLLKILSFGRVIFNGQFRVLIKLNLRSLSFIKLVSSLNFLHCVEQRLVNELTCIELIRIKTTNTHMSLVFTSKN